MRDFFFDTAGAEKDPFRTEITVGINLAECKDLAELFELFNTIRLFQLNFLPDWDEYMNGPGTRLRKEIQKALRLYERFGCVCLSDAELGRLLGDLRSLIRRTDRSMLRSGAVSACTRCAASGKGSCCFAEMGESYEFMGLFVNLLLGSNLPEKTDLPESCHFVGDSGCKLQARQSFCLNYFCPELKDFLGEETILMIRRLVGEQLLAGWELERALARYMENADIREHVGRSPYSD